jgi:hypothetical protein
VITQSQLLSALLDSCRPPEIEVRFEADGLSMLPLIRPGDVVHVAALTELTPRLGDVVAVRGMPGGGLLVHRVVRKSGGRFVIRGDNTTMANGEFAREDILAIVTAVERRARERWFGAGRGGRLLAWAVRTGLANKGNRACLKFRSAVTRLREHKGDDGNE